MGGAAGACWMLEHHPWFTVGKAFTADETGRYAGEHDTLEHMAQHIAFAGSAHAGSWRTSSDQGTSLSRSSRQNQRNVRRALDLFAQTPLRADAVAVADDGACG